MPNPPRHHHGPLICWESQHSLPPTTLAGIPGLWVAPAPTAASKRPALEEWGGEASRMLVGVPRPPLFPLLQTYGLLHLRPPRQVSPTCPPSPSRSMLATFWHFCLFSSQEGRDGGRCSDREGSQAPIVSCISCTLLAMAPSVLFPRAWVLSLSLLFPWLQALGGMLRGVVAPPLRLLCRQATSRTCPHPLMDEGTMRDS